MKKTPVLVKVFTEPLPYPQGLELMRRVHAERVAGSAPDTLLLMEHPPVITLGANSDASGILTPPETLRGLSIDVVRVERGGQATIHLPGQLVAYPILNLRERDIGVRVLVEALEETLLATAAAFGLKAFRKVGAPGIYLQGGKLASLGIAIKSGVTLHGVALNVACDLSLFRHIVPCGQPDTPPVSLSEALGATVPPERALEAYLTSFSEVFGDIIR